MYLSVYLVGLIEGIKVKIFCLDFKIVGIFKIFFNEVGSIFNFKGY